MYFNPDFLEKTQYFSAEEIRAIDNHCDFSKLERGEKSLFNKLSFDFIYATAKIEGNSYTKIEALSLLQTRTTAGYKPLNDAIEILNIQEAFNFIVDYTPQINKTTIKELHQILSKDLLPRSAQGKARDKEVYISGSDYIPLSNADQLEIQMDRILQNYHQIKDPFNKAVYIHNNVAYLQYFQDCNKRLSRVLQNLSLIKDKKMILSFMDLSKKKIDTYKNSLIAYYEKGDYMRYKRFFSNEYKKILDLIKTVSRDRSR